MTSILHIGICTKSVGLTSALKKRFAPYNEIPTDCVNLNEAIHNSAPADITFIQIQSPGISPSVIQELRNRGSFCLNWSGDVRSTIPEWMHDFDPSLTCFSNMNDVDAFVGASDFLQIGIDPKIFTRDGMKVRCPDIVYMGNSFTNQFPLSPLRREVVHFLHEKFGTNFGVYGGGWMFPIANYNGNQEAEACVYRSCKIAINLSHFDYRRYTSDRMFRIMGSGAFCLTKWYPEIETDFTDGVNVVVWRTMPELQEKIQYYLRHPEERQKIADAGYGLVHNTFLYEHMAKNIQALYEKWK